MKKYIRTSKITTDEEAKEIESLVWDKLAATGFLDSLVDSVEVKQLQRSYACFVTLIRKSYNGNRLGGKKFKESPIEFSSAEESVEDLIYRIYAFVTEHSEVLAEDAYVELLKIDGVPVGYYAGTTYSRMSAEIAFTKNPKSKHVERFKTFQEEYETTLSGQVGVHGYNDLVFIDIITPSQYNQLLDRVDYRVNDDTSSDDTSSSEPWEWELRRITMENLKPSVVCRILETDHTFTIEYIKLSDAPIITTTDEDIYQFSAF